MEKTVIDEVMWQQPHMQKLLSIVMISLAEVVAMRMVAYAKTGSSEEATSGHDEVLNAIDVLLNWTQEMMEEDANDEIH